MFGAQKPATFGFGATTAAPAFGATAPAFGQPQQTAFGQPAQPAAPAFGQPTPSAFGQTTTPAFGASTTPGFGATQPAFGTSFGGTTSTFGQPATTSTFGAPATGFGATTSAFGTSTPAPAFGATTTQPTTFGFGATQPTATPAASPFGASTSTFGTTTTAFGTTAAPAFGASTTTPAFGASTTPSPFGQSTTSAFGNTTNAFGAATTTPAFGASTGTTTAFGASTAASPFGAKPTTGFGFGTQPSTFGAAPATSTFSTGFGTTTAQTPGLFGQPAQQTTGGLFGAATQQPSAFGASAFGAQPASQGTGNPKYQETSEQDPNNPAGGILRQTAITVMPAYAQKSFEELRWEDYQMVKAGQKQWGQVAGPSTGGLFGATSTPGFGATASPFGAPAATSTPSLFGAPATPAPSPFGATAGTTSAFGQPAQPTQPAAGGFSFGQQPAQQQTSAFSFGQTPAATSTPSFSFGQTPGQQPQQQQSTLGTFSFGTSTTPAASPFGTATTQPAAGAGGFSFGTGQAGAQQQQQKSLFGTPTTTGTTGGFGFGTTTPATTTPSFSFGGATSTPSFQPASGGLFGMSSPAQQAPATGGLFGGATGSTFGTTTPSTTGGLFGTTATTTPSFSFNLSQPAAQQQAQQQPQPAPTVTSNPFGSNPLFAAAAAPAPTPTLGLAGAASGAGSGPVGLSQKQAVKVSTPLAYKSTPRSTVKITPRGASRSAAKSALFDGADGAPAAPGAAFPSPEMFVPRISKKTLVIEGPLGGPDSSPGPADRTSGAVLDLAATPGGSAGDKAKGPAVTSPTAEELATPVAKSRTQMRELTINGTTPGDTPGPANGDATPLRSAEKTPAGPSGVDKTPASRGKQPAGGVVRPTPRRAGRAAEPEALLREQEKRLSKGSPKLFPEGALITTEPTMEEFARMSSEELAHVKNLKVSHPHAGYILWPEADVRGVDFAKVILFNPEKKQVEVYPDLDSKPPRGEKLNRRATIVLHGLFPKRRDDPEAARKYREKLELSCSKVDARFGSYDPATGEWVFHVEHFSKYGLLDDEDEDLDEPAPDPRPLLARAIPLPPSDDEEEGEGEGAEGSAAAPGRRAGSWGPDVPMAVPVASYGDEEGAPEAMVTEDEEPAPLAVGPAEADAGADGGRGAGFLPRQLGLDAAKLQVMKLDEMDFCGLPKGSAPGFASFFGRGEEAAARRPDAEARDSLRLLPDHDDEGRGRAAARPRLSGASLALVPRGPASTPQRALLRFPRRRRLMRGPDRVCAATVTVARVTCGPAEAVGLPREAALAFHEALLTVSHQHSSRRDDGAFALPSGAAAMTPVLRAYAQRMADAAAQLETLGAAEAAAAARHGALAWRLIDALWGEQTEPPAPAGGASDYVEELRRRFALTRWLKEAVEEAARGDAGAAAARKDHVQAALAHLSGRQVREACEALAAGGDAVAAAMAAQAGGSERVREYVRQQLDVWQRSGVAGRISADRIRLLKLLSGDTTVLPLLDWKRALGVHLWYGVPTNAPLARALEAYDAAVAAGRSRPALPPPLEEPLLAAARPRGLVAALAPGEALPGPPRGARTCSRSCCGCTRRGGAGGGGEAAALDVPRMLSSEAASGWPLDAALGWHVRQALEALAVLPANCLGDAPHLAYAAQLEAAGLQAWALYPALHLPDAPRREAAEAGEAGEARARARALVLRGLGVREETLLRGEAALARSRWGAALEVERLLACCEYRAAHAALVQRLAPRVVARDDPAALARLRDLLLALEHNAAGALGREWEVEARVEGERLPGGARLAEALAQREPGPQPADLHVRFCLAEMSTRAAQNLLKIRRALALAAGRPALEGSRDVARLLPGLTALPDSHRLEIVRQLSADLVAARPAARA
eukprot:tig00000663_g2954.t1